MGFSASKNDNQEKIGNDENVNKKTKKKDKIKIIYNINDSNVIRLFGDKFVKRYKNSVNAN